MKFLAFLMCLLLSPVTHALALTDIELRSFLNQPLDAQIRLLSVAEGDLSSLRVRISSLDDDSGNQSFQALRHEVVSIDEESYIRLSSVDVIREPILSFKVEVNWSGGRLVREYSVLIDPQ